MEDAGRQQPSRLLAPDEPPPFEILNEASRRPVIVACDHASNRFPRRLAHLGLEERYRDDHIAWDPGAGAIARSLSKDLGVCAVLGGYSRLVIDLNRDLDDPTAFPETSDGVLVPGNLGLTVEQRAARARVFYKPYHETLNRVIWNRASGGRTPVVICIHSFTPQQNGVRRPWHVGVLWDRDPRLALPLLAALRAPGDLVVGDNEPYSGRHPADYTVDHHAEASGFAYAAIEIRQDLIADEGGQRQWAKRMAGIFDNLLKDEGLYRPLEFSPQLEREE